MTAHPELADAAAELAHHWRAAGALPAALRASVQAAAQAERMHAHHEALGHLRRALELWEKVPDPEALSGSDRVELLLRASEVADHAGSAELSVELALEARRAVDARAHPGRAAAAEERAGAALWNAGRADEALEHLADVVRLVPEHPPSIERANALAAYGRMLMLTGAFARARGYLEEALELARPLHARLVEASTLNTLAFVYSQCGDRQRAIAAGREGLRIATELEAGSETLRAYINGSQAIDDDGRLEEALALGLEGAAVAHRLGLDRHAGDQLRMQAAWRLIRLGRFGDADSVIRPAVENATLQFNIAATKNVAGYLAAARGEFDVAEDLLEQAWELMQRSGGFQLIGLGLAWRISLYLWRGDAERARRLADEALTQASQAEGQLMYNAALTWLAARAQADRAARARDLRDHADAERAVNAAATALTRLSEAIGSYPGAGAPPESLAFQTLASAELDRARGTRDIGAWQAAAERFAALGEAYHAAYADMRTAEALALTGAPVREIGEPLRRAHAAAVELGVVPFRDEVEELARRARVALADPAPRDRGIVDQLGLTAREIEVLALLAEGRTNSQIGQELFITAKTASSHVSRILMKLGVSNRAEAAAAAHRLGLASK
jgi:ATP/maltotriose-dependent transcriptional regulator MalT